MKKVLNFLPRRFRRELQASRKHISHLTTQSNMFECTARMYENRCHDISRNFMKQLKKANRWILILALFNVIQLLTLINSMFL